MKQVLLYSIKPEHIANILNGKKTVEVRKRDLPLWALEALKRGDKVIGYGYCTKGGEILSNDIGFYTIYHMPPRYKRKTDHNGLIVVRFEIDLVIPFEFIDGQLCVKADNREQQLRNIHCLNEEATCLTYEQLQCYVGSKMGFAHHLTNITPIEPMKISEFYKEEYAVMPNGVWPSFQPLQKSPQSFMTAWVEE